MNRRFGLKLLASIGVPVTIIAGIVLLWDWDWFVPFVAARASAEIGRPVTIEHLHVRLGQVSTFEGDGVTVANPQGWPQGPPLAQIQRIVTRVDLLRYISHHQLVVSLVEIDRPVVAAEETAEGKANFRLNFAGGSDGSTEIDDVRIVDGQAHVVVPKLKANLTIALFTREESGHEPQVLAEARGTYAGQPITGQMAGGALLALRANSDVSRPPIPI